MDRQQKVALGVAIYAAARSKTGLGFVARLIAIWLAMILFGALLGAGIAVYQHFSVAPQGSAQAK